MSQSGAGSLATECARSPRIAVLHQHDVTDDSLGNQSRLVLPHRGMLFISMAALNGGR